MTVYCDNETCIYCTALPSAEREDWECTCPDNMSFTMVPKDEAWQTGLVWCDNYKEEEL